MTSYTFTRASLAAGLLAATILSTGCASKKQPDAMGTISGTLSCRQDIPLSPTAVAYVRLADVTRGPAQSTTVLQQELTPGELSAMPFALSYKEKMIDPRHEYAVDVRVVDQGKLQYISSEKYPVLTNGHSNTVSMLLERPGSH